MSLQEIMAVNVDEEYQRWADQECTRRATTWLIARRLQKARRRGYQDGLSGLVACPPERSYEEAETYRMAYVSGQREREKFDERTQT